MNKGYQPKLERTKNVASFYKACMNVKGAKAGELRNAKYQMNEILSAREPAALRRLINDRIWKPYFNLLGLGQDANQQNPVLYDLMITNPGMTLPEKTAYEDKRAVEDLRKLARTLFTELKTDKPAERADALVAFEKRFAESYPIPADLRKLWTDDTYIKRDDLKKQYPQIDFDKVFAGIPQNTSVRRLTKDAMDFINTYLGEASAFDLQSVLLFHSLRDRMDDQYPKYYKVYFNFQHRHRGGAVERPPRDERCTRMAMWRLGRELDAELLEVMFPEFDTAKVREAGEAVRASIIAGLKKNTWLSDSARKEAIKKTQSAQLKLVKPDAEADWDFLDLKTPLSDRDHVGNLEALDRAELDRVLDRFKKDRNRNRWYMSPMTVNAYYTADDNQFVLPQGILQYPFFDPNMALIENLGAMGAVMGHELGHGIDDEGSKFDSTGRKRQWMKDSDLKAFGERGGKLVAQFNRVDHDGRLALGENIADNVGLRFAFEAAFPNAQEAAEDDLKTFFHSYGRLWCGTLTPEARKMQLKTGPHALNHERINQQVVHNEYFYKAFACKEGDKMYLKPEERVQIW